jgi:bifunctional DNase/RNase
MRALLTITAAAAAALACGSGAVAGGPCPPGSGSGGAEAVPDPGPPAGFVEVDVVGVLPTEQGNALVLRSDAVGRMLPIFIGDAEATVIQMRLAGRPFERPMTHDLLDRLVDELGGRLVRVLVTKVSGNIFIGTVVLRQDGRTIQVDARPSDAIALAVGNRAPVFVARQLLESAGLPLDQFGE